MDWDDGNLAAHGLTVYEGWSDEHHAYDVWVHHSRDNGCVFIAGTLELFAGRYQDHWRTADGVAPHPLDEELHAAEADAGRSPGV
jgi:hypothetical protein